MIVMVVTATAADMHRFARPKGPLEAKPDRMGIVIGQEVCVVVVVLKTNVACRLDSS